MMSTFKGTNEQRFVTVEMYMFGNVAVGCACPPCRLLESG